MTMTRWLLETVASDAVLLFVADTILKATLLLCLAALGGGLSRRASAAVRHRIWAFSLCALIILPAVSWMIPGWNLPILPARSIAGAPREKPLGESWESDELP